MEGINANSSKDKIKRLIENLEKQTKITYSNIESYAPVATLKSCYNIHKSIQQQMINIFGTCEETENEVYTFLGMEMNWEEILALGKQLGEDLKNIIYVRSLMT